MLVGIDLGTTNSLVSVWRDGQAVLIENSAGKIMTPSVVSVDEDGSIIVGEIARERLLSHPDSTASEFKRTMGTDTKYTLGNRVFTSEELSALVLKKLLLDAETMLKEKVTEAVISVPAYFDDNQREATKQAALLAGISVKRLVNEPSSATLYHRLATGMESKEGYYAVIDFGGGTLDVSIVDCYENIIEILAISGNNRMGGKDFDEQIAKDFCEKNHIMFESLSHKEREHMIRAAENVKKKLTYQDYVEMHMVIHGVEYHSTYNNDRLMQLTASLLVELRKVVSSAIKAAKLDVSQIEDVILVGGTTKMPVIQTYLSALFKKELHPSKNCESLVGLGTGVLTGIICRNSSVKDIVMTDVCPFSLGTKTYNHVDENNGYMSVIIPKNSILPISVTRTFSGVSPYQKGISFDVLQGEELYAKNNLLIGNVRIKTTPNANGETLAEVTYTYDINGILEVEAVDCYGDHKVKTLIDKSFSKYSEEELSKRKMSVSTAKLLEVNKEENRAIVAWGERLYAQADEEQRVYIKWLLDNFSQSVYSNDKIQVLKKRSSLAQKFLALEMQINRDCFFDENNDKEEE